MRPETARLFPNLSPKQEQFVRELLKQKYKRMYFGGAMGGGKTFLVLSIADELCKTYPNVHIGVLRKSLTSLKRTTIKSFYKVLAVNNTPPEDVHIHKTTWEAKYLRTGSTISFIDADQSKDPQLNRLKGLELTIGIVEECNEVSKEVVDVFISRIGRWYNKELGIKPVCLLTSNPDNNWVKTEFYDKWKRDTLPPTDYYLPALPSDNTKMEGLEDYLENLKTMPPDLYARYALGDWDYIVDKNQLIKTVWMDEAATETPLRDREPYYLGIDFAREGGDQTVLAFYDDTALLWTERHKFDTAGPVADIVEQHLSLHPTLCPDLIAVDAIGNGASLIDTLAERKVHIGSFKGSEKATRALEHFSFYNRRMEANWMFREDIRLKRITMNYNEVLWRQSQTARYFTKEKYMIMEDKEEMRKSLGQSPDDYDAAVIGNFIRNDYYNYGRISTSYVKTLLKSKTRQELGNRKYLSSVKQMIY